MSVIDPTHIAMLGLNWRARHWHTDLRAQAPVPAYAGSRVYESHAR
jgi:hypothetical protein